MVKSNKFANKLRPGISHWISTYAPKVDKIKAMIVPAIVVITEIINGWDSVGFLNTEMYPARPNSSGHNFIPYAVFKSNESTNTFHIGMIISKLKMININPFTIGKTSIFFLLFISAAPS